MFEIMAFDQPPGSPKFRAASSCAGVRRAARDAGTDVLPNVGMDRILEHQSGCAGQFRPWWPPMSRPIHSWMTRY